MRDFTTDLARYSVPNRMRYFPGPHAWPPDSLMSEAIAWFELRAMKSGKTATRAAFVDSLFARDRAAAGQLERSGKPAEALDRWREILADYDGLKNVAAADQKVVQLTKDPSLKRALSRRAELRRQSEEYRRKVDDWINKVRAAAKLPTAAEGAKALDIEKLKKRAAETSDVDAALAAQRQLEDVYVQLSFYQPRQFTATGRGDLAAVFQQIAAMIKP